MPADNFLDHDVRMFAYHHVSIERVLPQEHRAAEVLGEKRRQSHGKRVAKDHRARECCIGNLDNEPADFSCRLFSGRFNHLSSSCPDRSQPEIALPECVRQPEHACEIASKGLALGFLEV